MNLANNISNSFDYAKKLLSNFGKFAILIVLSIIPIVNLIVWGYLAKVVKETPRLSELSELEDYVEMFIQGLKVLVAGILYMIVPLALMGVGFLSILISFGPMWLPEIPNVWSIGPVGIILVIAGIALLFIIAILASIGIVHMVKTNSLGKAFSFGEILEIIGKIGWGKYIVWLIVIFVIGLIVGWIGAIPYIGWIISLVISPIYGVFLARSAGLIYNDGTSDSAEYPSSRANYCKFCGSHVSQDSTYCQNCGKEI